MISFCILKKKFKIKKDPKDQDQLVFDLYLQLVNFGGRAARDFGEDEPGNDGCNRTCACEKEARLDSPLCAAINHEWCTLHVSSQWLASCMFGSIRECASDADATYEAEHNGDQIRQGQGPSCSLRAKPLLRDLGGIGIADCRCASGGKGRQTRKEHLPMQS